MRFQDSPRIIGGWLVLVDGELDFIHVQGSNFTPP
jgi:hypothetical protein